MTTPLTPLTAAPAEAEDTADTRVLPGARMRVTPAEGAPYVVRITNPDYLAWDRTAPRKKWGSSRDVPFLFATFLAWSAARRGGLTEQTFDAFCDTVADVDPVRDEDEDDDARPTRPAPAHG